MWSIWVVVVSATGELMPLESLRNNLVDDVSQHNRRDINQVLPLLITLLLLLPSILLLKDILERHSSLVFFLLKNELFGVLNVASLLTRLIDTRSRDYLLFVLTLVLVLVCL